MSFPALSSMSTARSASPTMSAGRQSNRMKAGVETGLGGSGGQPRRSARRSRSYIGSSRRGGEQGSDGVPWLGQAIGCRRSFVSIAPDHAQRRFRYIRSLWRFEIKEYAQHPLGHHPGHVQCTQSPTNRGSGSSRLISGPCSGAETSEPIAATVIAQWWLLTRTMT